MDPLKATPPQETKLHFLDYWRIIRIRKTVILAVFLLVVITATLVTFILPEAFSSVARIKIERDQSDIAGFQERGGFGAYDPYFIQTEFEVIQSQLILGKVINELDLNREWGKKYASGELLKTTETIQLLKSRIELRPVRNTSLIEIRVFSEKPAEAKKIANAVADAYANFRHEERKKLSMGGIASLEDRWKEQEQKVHKAQEELDKLRKDLRVPDSVVNADAPAQLMTAETLRHIESLRIESKYQFGREEAMLAKLKDLSAEDLVQTLPTAAPDGLLSSLLEQKTLAEQSLLVVRKDYGAEHTETIKASSRVEDLNNKIKDRVKGIMLGLDNRVEA